jgi:peptide/nickel transport system permease protein
MTPLPTQSTLRSSGPFGVAVARRAAAMRAMLVHFPLPAMLWCALLIVAAVFGEALAPYKASTADFSAILAPPAWMEGGSLAHVFGTDQLGRDILSRLIVGARISLLTSGVAIFVSGVVGVLLGTMAGYAGGWTSAIIMRVTDAFLSLPFMLMALALVAATGSGLANIIIVMILTNWARYARLVHSEVLSIRTRDFVTLARVAGVKPHIIAARHVLPNALNSIAVLAVLDVGRAIMLESSLSFLGLGIQPPEISWGLMLADGKTYIEAAWWVTAIPGMAIVLAVISFNAVGEALKAYLDPRGHLSRGFL